MRRRSGSAICWVMNIKESSLNCEFNLEVEYNLERLGKQYRCCFCDKNAIQDLYFHLGLHAYYITAYEEATKV